jgi:hypothetical protein
MDYSRTPMTFPNLNPAAAIPIDRNQVFHLHSFAGNYRMSRGKEHGQYVPNSRFVFVTTSSGSLLLHQRFRHPALAEGKPVLYAGEANFNNGKLEWWSNGSGNYRPDIGHAAQAGLPMEQFYSYDAILKGAHTQPRIHGGALPGNSTPGGTQAVQAKPAYSKFAVGVQAKYSRIRSHSAMSNAKAPTVLLTPR